MCMRVERMRSRSDHFVFVVDTKCRRVVSSVSQPCFHTGCVRWPPPRRFLTSPRQRFLLKARVSTRFLVKLTRRQLQSPPP